MLDAAKYLTGKFLAGFFVGRGGSNCLKIFKCAYVVNEWSLIDSWRDDEKDDKKDLIRERSKIYNRNAHYLNDLLYLSLQFICLNFKLRNFQRVNQVSFKEDNYLTEKLSKFQLLKGKVSERIGCEESKKC